MINSFDQWGWLSPLKNQYFAKFSGSSYVHIISESFGHAPVSPHIESTEGGLGDVGTHTPVLEVIIRLKDRKLVELSCVC